MIIRAFSVPSFFDYAHIIIYFLIMRKYTNQLFFDYAQEYQPVIF